jgi:hypothetical protein
MWETEGFGQGPGILVNGSFLNKEVGQPFATAVIAAAKNAGFGKFRVFLGGEEISTDRAPALFEEDTQVEIRPYDVAGNI